MSEWDEVMESLHVQRSPSLFHTLPRHANLVASKGINADARPVKSGFISYCDPATYRSTQDIASLQPQSAFQNLSKRASASAKYNADKQLTQLRSALPLPAI